MCCTHFIVSFIGVDRKTYTWSSPKSSHSWNPWTPADFTMKSSGFHEIQWKSVKSVNSDGFHREIREIWQISPVKIWRISPMKSGGFHEIWQISWNLWNTWNLADFTLKSSRFHPWNLADFTQISPVKSTQNYKSKCFSKNSSVWWMQGGGFHPWNPPDFHPEIWWISPVKSGRFHLWNPPKIIKASVSAKTLQFDEWRVGDFTLEIHQIFTLKSGGFHLWNLADFTCEIHPKIIKASVSAKTLQFDECRVGDFTLKSGGFHPWNLADFTQISPMKSIQNYKSKCFSKNSSVWWMQGGGFHPRNPVDFTLKSGGFQPWNLVDFTCEIHPKL